MQNGVNFKMAATGTQPEDLFPGVCSSRVSVGQNIYELHNHYQQGGTKTVAFSQLASYILSIGVDLTGLGWWSWIQVGAGEHWTWTIMAYQPCLSRLPDNWKQNGLMKSRGTTAVQHEWYFWKKGNFNKPRDVFHTQLVTQLRAWQAAGEEVILFIDVNKNVFLTA